MLPLPPRRLEGALLPRRGGRPRRRRDARRAAVPREGRAATCGFLAKHRGAREAERARRLLRAALRVRGLVFRGERGRVYADAARWLGGPLARRCWRRRTDPSPSWRAPSSRSASRACCRRTASGSPAAGAPRSASCSCSRAGWSRRRSAAAAGRRPLVWTLAALAAALGGRVRARAAVRRGRARSGRARRDGGSSSRSAAGAAAPARRHAHVLAAGALFGIALWHVAGHVGGDGLFHLARVRKLVELDALSPSAVSEFADGGLHPGYAFPLWHAFLALSRGSRASTPSSSSSTPRACSRRSRSSSSSRPARALPLAWLAFGAVAAQVALIALAAGHGGAYVTLTNPGTASRQLLVPATLALFFAVCPRAGAGRARWHRGRQLSPRARPPDLLAVPRRAARRLPRGPVAGRLVRLPRLTAALGAFVVPAVATLAVLYPIARNTASHAPDPEGSAARSACTARSSTSSPTATTASRPRSCPAAGRSPSPRSRSCRSRPSRARPLGGRSCSAGRSPCSC